jgi:hypothetical protein
MIVDYNYKPYVETVVTGFTAFDYNPPFKNNKGVIIFAGNDGFGPVLPTVNFYTPSGNTGGIDLNDQTSGSFNDLYMQFNKRETTTGVRSSDILLSRTNANDAAFFPITYQSLSFAGGTAPFSRSTVIITLY